MADYYPPLAFHFKVTFNNVEGETAFQSVDGLTVELETEQVAEGGENRFKHVLPVRSKYPHLVLKRGLITNSDLIKWCREALEDMVIEPTDITISLLNEKHEPLMTWNVAHAYPVKWSVSNFNAEESKLVIETIELTYNYFKLQ
ncbi:phage tail protein [Saccharicrinis sp. FJH54]|uniref:phage tail protein n=1 Tax=Saccharicrinis sp. FJH54 TaxID=3344665 RepID=UPI0035D45146